MSHSMKLRHALINLVLFWNHPIIAMLCAALVYCLLALSAGFEASNTNYFAYLADAFLHGQASLRILPPLTHDLILIGDKTFLYFPPMPAVLMMPLVAIWGVAASDVILDLAIGSFNVFLFASLLRVAKHQALHNLEDLKQALLIIFFSFGTVHITLVPYGNVWQLSQEISLMFILLTYLAAIGLRGWSAFLLTGLGLAGAILTRNHLFLVGIWPAFWLIRSHWEKRYRGLIYLLGLSSLPIVLAGVLLLGYNHVRFGGAFEIPFQYMNFGEYFSGLYEEHGYFDIHYIPTNIYYHFLSYPFPLKSDWQMGGSLFLLSPIFFAVFWSFKRKEPNPSNIFLLLTIVAVYIPIVLLLGTGYVQFGMRYSLDFIVPLLLLTARGLENWPSWVIWVLTAISCVQMMVGALLIG